MGFVSYMSVSEFLRRRFRRLSDGGYAGLVFLLARPADSPALHERFFTEWTDMHDVTRRYLAVITPAPSVIRLDSQSPHLREDSPVIRGVECLSDSRGLNTPAVNAYSKVAMNARQGNEIALAPTLPGEVAGHRDALTVAASEMRRFFGVSEALLPCAVFVCLLERKAVVVALDGTPTLYPLLKRIRIGLEPVLTTIDRVDAELEKAKAARQDHQRRIGDLRTKAQRVGWDWHRQLDRLAQDLSVIAGSLPENDAALCRSVASYLAGTKHFTAEKQASAHALARAFGAAGIHGKVPQRLKRALAKIAAGYPDTHDVVTRLAALADEISALQRRIGQLKTQIDDCERELHLGAALVAAAGEFGIEPVGSQGLLPWRELAWPTEVLAAREPTSRPRSTGAASTTTANRVDGTAGGHVVQAATIHGGVHIHRHTNDSGNA
ncbi:hypothetical protein [Amycolatopsis sp. GA6-003]|uniref:hypothetical protein n=1 Tax=Amycolatopsis sp. GA6-003 TaxID=2652444 RepID=UPI0039172372